MQPTGGPPHRKFWEKTQISHSPELITTKGAKTGNHGAVTMTHRQPWGAKGSRFPIQPTPAI